MAELTMVRVNVKLIEDYKRKNPELKELSNKDIVSIMLRKALEADS